MGREEAAALIARYDLNQDGVLDYSEFVKVCAVCVCVWGGGGLSSRQQQACYNARDDVSPAQSRATALRRRHVTPDAAGEQQRAAAGQ